MTITQALRETFGDGYFTAAEALAKLNRSLLPASVQIALRRGVGEPVKGLGRHLTASPDLERLQTGKHAAFYRVRSSA